MSTNVAGLAHCEFHRQLSSDTYDVNYARGSALLRNCTKQATAHQRLLDSWYDSLASFKQEAVTAPTCSKLLRDSDYANIALRERQLAEVIAVGFLTLTKLLRARAIQRRQRGLLDCSSASRLSPGAGLGWVVKLGLHAPAVHNLQLCTADTYLSVLVSTTIGASEARRDASTVGASQSCQGGTLQRTYEN